MIAGTFIPCNLFTRAVALISKDHCNLLRPTRSSAFIMGSSERAPAAVDLDDMRIPVSPRPSRYKRTVADMRR